MDPCGNEVVADVASPSGAHRAVIFERDCGATTSWSTQVAVIGGDETFLEDPTWWKATSAGSALVIKDRATRPGVEGTTVKAKWPDDQHLILEYDAGAAVARSAKAVEGITIDVRAVERHR
jgi:hypothetical protein